MALLSFFFTIFGLVDGLAGKRYAGIIPDKNRFFFTERSVAQ